MLFLLWTLPLIIGIYWYAWKKKQGSLMVFIEKGLIDRNRITTNYSGRKKKAVFMMVAIIFLVISAARPSWNMTSETVEQRGRDVVFLLDVSKSMLAEDLAPNRLERAKLAIKDCIEVLDGDRVALVVFAGSAAVKCPLTLDYGFFRLMLDHISTNSIERGGTMVGDALRKVMTDVFDDRAREFRDIILITDGEDHESFPVEAAENVGQKEIRLIAIGLGDENEGKRIPITNENGEKAFLTHNGQEIWSRLDADTLRKMTGATPGGKYLNVSTGTINLGNVYSQLVAGADEKKLESRTLTRYEEKFQIFLAIGLFLICLEMITRDREKENKRNA
jgi:Ca-activated chloride channel homolog